MSGIVTVLNSNPVFNQGDTVYIELIGLTDFYGNFINSPTSLSLAIVDSNNVVQTTVTLGAGQIISLGQGSFSYLYAVTGTPGLWGALWTVVNTDGTKGNFGAPFEVDAFQNPFLVPAQVISG
jgi:hypothetical protein